MKTRFKRGLYDLFAGDGISLESGIVNDLIYQMAGIEFDKKEKGRSGFELSDSWNNKEELKFELPHLKWAQVQKLLALFKYPVDNYVANSPLKLDNEAFVFNELLPEITKFYHSQDVEFKRKYIIKSKPILESSATVTLRCYAEETCDTMMPSESVFTQLPENLEKVYQAALLLNAMVDKLSTNPSLYKSINETAKKFDGFMEYPEVVQNPVLMKKLKLIREGIDLFTKTNRCESVLGNRAFNKDMEAFLVSAYQISATQCNVIEDLLLRLSNASLGIKGGCHVKVGNDPSRMIFQFSDIDAANTAKIVEYLQNAGDDTATEGEGYRQYGSVIPEAMMMMESTSMKSMDYDKTPDPVAVVERHNIEVDGKFLFEVLHCRMIAELIAMETKDPTTLQRYRDESRKYFEKKAADEALKGNKSVMFQPKTVAPEEAVACENKDTLRLAG